MRKRWRAGIALFLVILLVAGWFDGDPASKAAVVSEEYFQQLLKENSILIRGKAHTKQSFSYPGCQVEQLTAEYWVLTGTGKPFQRALKALRKRTDVVSMQKNYSYCLAEDEILPNDTYANQQWWISNDGSFSYLDESGNTVTAVRGVDCNIPGAWESYQSQAEVVVAVIDTGVDVNHEDLRASIWTNTGEIPGNGIDDDNNGYVDDVHGWDFYNGDNTLCVYGTSGKAKVSDNDNHGTHCAGTIAATAGNQMGIAGAASNINIKIMPIKALGGSNGATNTAKLIKAIRYAMNNGADIVNASWGGWVEEQEDLALKRVIARSGLLFVAAAGNEGKNSDVAACYPASYSADLSNVIAVGSLDCTGKRSAFSNYGIHVDILAPGNRIYSTTVGGYATMSGTSMATPIVTGIAAMLYADHAGVYPATVKQTLLSSYRQLDTVSALEVSRPGIIDAKMAVERRGMLDTDLLEPSFVELTSDFHGNIKVSAVDQGNAGVAAILYAYGKKHTADFRRGAKGTLVTGNKVQVKKSGTYTFYVYDLAGNSSIKWIDVTADNDPPVIKALRKKNRVTLQVKDSGMGVSYARFSYGRKRRSYFEAGKGQKLKKNGKKPTTMNRGKKYVSVYAEDYAGNVTYKIYRLS